MANCYLHYLYIEVTNCYLLSAFRGDELLSALRGDELLFELSAFRGDELLSAFRGDELFSYCLH